MSGEGKVEDKCQNPALPLNNFCIKRMIFYFQFIFKILHIFELSLNFLYS